MVGEYAAGERAAVLHMWSWGSNGQLHYGAGKQFIFPENLVITLPYLNVEPALEVKG